MARFRLSPRSGGRGQGIRVLLWLLLGAVALFALVRGVRRSEKPTIERLVMPGPVVQGHAEIEQACSKCHSPFSKDTQDQLCNDCHTEVGQDVTRGQGFHGRFSPVREMQCNACHTDHRGRDADIVRLDPETFRHEVTDFPLTGAHARVGVHCAACHVEGKKYREAPTDCFSCHAKEDVHKGALGTDCARCHQDTAWKDARFDHTTTRFPLEGKHQGVACYACHQNETYTNTPLDCIACHLVNDVHDSKPDERCERCHHAGGWTE